MITWKHFLMSNIRDLSVFTSFAGNAVWKSATYTYWNYRGCHGIGARSEYILHRTSELSTSIPVKICYVLNTWWFRDGFSIVNRLLLYDLSNQFICSLPGSYLRLLCQLRSLDSLTYSCLAFNILFHWTIIFFPKNQDAFTWP